MLYVLLSHDADWPIQGPGKNHILARQNRFTPEVIAKVKALNYNPYYNIPEIMDIEKGFGVKSTFFFRPRYEDGTPVDCYSKIMFELWRKGWEVGLHINDTSNVNTLRAEKNIIETVLQRPVYGARAHYHRIDPANLPLLSEMGIKYDSSIIHRRDVIDTQNMGYYKVGELVEFPVTLAEVFMFAPQCMNLSEKELVPTVAKAVRQARKFGFMSLVWHDCSLKMEKGRKFPEIIQFLVEQDNLRIIRCIDAYNLVINLQTNQL